MMTTFPYWNIYKKFGKQYGLTYTDILKAVDLYKQGIIPHYIAPQTLLEELIFFVMRQFHKMQEGTMDWNDGFYLPWEAS